LRALLVGLFAFVLVTQAAAAAMQGESAQASRKATVTKTAPTLDERLERKLAALRKYRGTVRFFENRRSLFASGDQHAQAQTSLAEARVRVRQLTTIVAALRAKIRARDTRRLAKLPPRRAICDVFGAYCEQAVAVARCESRLDTAAQNGQYRGLFQMGSHERSLFGHGSTAHVQARAAHRYFVRSGRDWSPWACRWAAY
jgi:hypothetical protein